MVSLLRCIFGPELYRIYKTETTRGIPYIPNALENWSSSVISTVYVAFRIGVWTSPVVVWYLNRWGYFSTDGAGSLLRLSVAVGALLALMTLVRGVGRWRQPHYRHFISRLQLARQPSTAHTHAREILTGYDFDMLAWPVDFIAEPVQVSTADESVEVRLRSYGALVRALSYMLAHTVGLRLMYPGTLGIMARMIDSHLREGRASLVEKHGGQRHLLQAVDGNHIDVMFVDRRNSNQFGSGNRLVITCEGNAGFYEIGAMSVPLEAGYSVLGWNHPGFAGSTGDPYPESEQHAIAAVIEFARRRLGFRREDTLLYAWSIGGYTATWAAANFRDISGLVLDATFDDIVPLAVARMPASGSAIVSAACLQYMNLNNGALLLRYPGPVLLIRRSQDEVITTRELDISTNRANDLLLLLLRARYPDLSDDVSDAYLERWVRGNSTVQDEVRREVAVDDDLCASLLSSYISENSESFPMMIGSDLSSALRVQLIIYLAIQYMIEFEGSHCSPLPGSFLREPWQPLQVSNGFVHVTRDDAAPSIN